MKYLYKLFHQYNHFKFQEIYDKRLLTDTLTKINLTINPINKSKVNELFYISTNEMLNKVAEIYRAAGKLKIAFNEWPSVLVNV